MRERRGMATGRRRFAGHSIERAQRRNRAQAFAAARVEALERRVLFAAGAALHYYDNRWWRSTTQDTNGYKVPSPVGLDGTATLNSPGGPIDFHSDAASQRPPGARPADDGANYSLVITGKIRTGPAGVYTFITQSDDDSYFVVNGKLVSSNPGSHVDGTGGVYNVPITLAADTEYNCQYYHSQGGGPHGFHARWIPPGDIDPTNGGGGELYAQAALIPLSSGAGSPGLSVTTADVPPAPTLPAGGQQGVYTAVSSDRVTINFTDNATSELRYVLERSTTPDFSSIELQSELPLALSTSAAGGTGAASILVTNLSLETTYYFRLRASNYEGQSANLDLGAVTTIGVSTPAQPLARVKDNGDVVLTWIDMPPVGTKVSVQRSVLGGPFAELTQVNILPAGGPNTYTDATFKSGGTTYRYRLQAIGDENNNTFAPPADVPFTVIPVSSSRPVDYTQGFSTSATIDGSGLYAGPSMDLRFNGNNESQAAGMPTLFNRGNGLASIRLTDTNPTGFEASSVWSNDKVKVTGAWMTQFDFQVSGGGDFPGDGFVFALQNDSSTFVGGTGGGGGYNGIGAKAVAVGFDTFNNHSTTGAFVGGGAGLSNGPISNDEVNDPYVPGLGTGHGLNLNPSLTGVDLKSGHRLRAVISYDGTRLSEMVLDLDDQNRVVFNYDYGAVNLQQVLGGDTAWVGFTGATGGVTEQVEIQNWVFARNNLAVDPPSMSFKVDDGTGQRSLVRSVSINFVVPVTLSSGALKLIRQVTDANGALTGATTDISGVLNAPTSTDGGITWKWTFVAGIAGNTEAGGSLTDGVYRVVVDHTKVTSTFSGDTMPADFTSARFHRLFGDVTGNKTVNTQDYGQFRLVFGKASTDAGFNPVFDFDGNGVVNTGDYGQFRNRFGRVFTY